MYILMSIVSVLVRQFCLPDPFEFLGESYFFVNWIVSFILPPIVYKTVGIVYEKNSFPFIGSFLYLLFFSIFIFLLWVMGKLNFAWWIDLIAIVVIFRFYRCLFWIKEKLNSW